jgi:Short-chain alcohol dehydrogenase of unknown specificity
VDDIRGAAVVVTGGAQGLGLEIARTVTGEGAHAVLLDVDEAALAAAGTAFGRSCTTHVCDIRDAAAVDAVLAAVQDRWPAGVRALVNNAGVFTDDAIEVVQPGRAELAVAVNVHGTMTVTNAVLDRGLLDPRSGQIVFVNSSAGDPPGSGTGASERHYAVSKGALTAYARVIAGPARSAAGSG